MHVALEACSLEWLVVDSSLLGKAFGLQAKVLGSNPARGNFFLICFSAHILLVGY